LASQGKVVDLSTTLSSKKCHSIKEGQFSCSGFISQVGHLAREVQAQHIDKYDGSSNSEEFIQIYHTVVEAAGGDDWVKANNLPMALSGMARSWCINMPEGSFYNWDQLYTMFIENF
jgi:hypothetical protein